MHQPFKGIIVCRIHLPDHLARSNQVEDIIVAGIAVKIGVIQLQSFGSDDIIVLQDGQIVLFIQDPSLLRAEIAPVMADAHIICSAHVLPHPVDPRQFPVIAVFRRYIIACVVACIAVVPAAGTAYVQRHINGVFRLLEFLMCHRKDGYCHVTSPLFWNYDLICSNYSAYGFLVTASGLFRVCLRQRVRILLNLSPHYKRPLPKMKPLLFYKVC